ncbi:hypothetical protein JRO89_XS13G0249800 [Xanthoceras sorbifolium]|uniref:Disease resistance protein At4g27190-like leucine-rich repeats domain-containing protein n=1 Tax=Xanthoceras sorbifolium TaxID=99658 RepID=A0ABQ8H9U6_9ROSI|nr:hypothetical protein JRO89_XS13G0249800 [Xanthoceras sorbifolium]
MFTPSVALGFVQLQELKIKNCAILEAIIVIEEETISNTMFPNLNILELIDLAEFTSFCNFKGNEIELPSLARLWIEKCPNMQTFISNFTGADMSTSKDIQPLFDEKMDKLRKIWHHQLTSDSFCKIASFGVYNCDNVLNVFPSNMLGRLQKLDELWLSNCSSLDEIFELQAYSCEKTQAIIATQLRKLVLYNLSKLKHVWDMNSQSLLKLKHVWDMNSQSLLTCQNLLSIQVTRCDSLKSVIPASVVKPSNGSLVWKKNLQNLTGLSPIGLVANVNWTVSRATPTIENDGDYHDMLIIGVYGPAFVIAVKRSTGKLVWSTQLDHNPAAVITMSVSSHIEECQERENNQTVPTHPDECVEPDNHSDSILALDLDSSKIKWYNQLGGHDVWFGACNKFSRPGCPPGPNPDADFWEAPMMLSIQVKGTKRDIVVSIQKSGFAWALDHDNGTLAWATEAGPGGIGGGGTWGAATDEKRRTDMESSLDSMEIDFTVYNPMIVLLKLHLKSENATKMGMKIEYTSKCSTNISDSRRFETSSACYPSDRAAYGDRGCRIGLLYNSGTPIYLWILDMGPNLWEDPTEFKPERFLFKQNVFDRAGNKEIKMMLPSVGRRIYPDFGVATQNLEYLVANLI